MLTLIRRTLATTVAALPLMGFVDLAAGQQQPGAQQATQAKEQRQQAQPQQPQAQPQRQVQPAQPAQPAQPGQVQRQAQPGLPAQPGQPGQLRQTTEYRASPAQGLTDKTLIDAFLIGPNQAEISLGQLAQQHAQNPEVKQFAERLIQDHSQFLQKLQGMASAAQPTAATQSELLQVIQDVDRHCQQAATEMLQKHQGAEFDQAYVGMMVMAHGKMLSTFEALRGKASPALQETLAQATDAAREHHDLAHALIKKLNPDSAAARSAALPGQPK